MPPWSIYILRCSDNSLYCGISTDVLARVAKHNSGEGAKYTRSRLPVSLVWSQEMESESAARVREHEIKKLSKAQKEAFLLS